VDVSVELGVPVPLRLPDTPRLSVGVVVTVRVAVEVVVPALLRVPVPVPVCVRVPVPVPEMVCVRVGVGDTVMVANARPSITKKDMTLITSWVGFYTPSSSHVQYSEPSTVSLPLHESEVRDSYVCRPVPPPSTDCD